MLDDVCTYSCHLPHDVGVLSSDFPCCLILLLGTFALLYIACSPWFALSIGVQRCTNKFNSVPERMHVHLLQEDA